MFLFVPEDYRPFLVYQMETVVGMEINIIKYSLFINMLHEYCGGWGGIRTHEERSPLPVFKTGAFDRSATHPA